MNFPHLSLGLFVTAICCFLFAVAPTTLGQSSAKGFRVAPGVLVDPGNEVVYIRTPKREVAAIALKDGVEAWSTSAAMNPVAVRQRRIIAQVEAPKPGSTLNLVTLAADDGEVIASATMDLGPDVVSSIDDGMEHQFVLGTAGFDTSEGSILWRFYHQKRTGPGEPPATPLERFGALNVNVAEAVDITPVPGGGSSRKSGQPPYSQPRVLRPVSEKPPPNRIILDLETGQRYRLDGVAVPPDADANPAAAALKPPKGGLIITEGRPGEEFPPTRRLAGEQFSSSSDGRHILASAFGGKIEAAEPYRWTIYERGTFTVAARFSAQTSLAPFVVMEGRVLYLRQPFQRSGGGKVQDFPLALVARDTERGQIVWTQPVRDTRYTGPVPE